MDVCMNNVLKNEKCGKDSLLFRDLNYRNMSASIIAAIFFIK